MLSQPGDIWALIAAGLGALTLTLAGNVRGSERAAEWFEAGAPACGVFAAMATPYLQLARALTAIRVLDDSTAADALDLASALEEGSEFWTAYAWIRSLHDLTWRDPDYGLARLEAAVANHQSTEGEEDLSGALATRAKADLLCSAGRINEANALLKAGSSSKLNRYHLVSEARMHLCGQDGPRAIRTAEVGLHDPAVPSRSRAHLQAITTAGLLLTGAEPALVRTALHSACTLCTEGVDVLPFLFIPAHLRTRLLELHDQIEHTSPCILNDSVIRARLDEVRDNFESSPALVRLTPREVVLLPLLATSDTVHAIAKGLHVSVNTVRKQVTTLRDKLAAPDRANLIAKAYRLGLLARR